MSVAPHRAPRASDDQIDELIDVLVEADRLHARAAKLLAGAMAAGGVALRRGLPVEVLLRLAGRLTRGDATRLLGSADLVRDLPRTAGLVERGVVSASQASWIAAIIRPLDLAGRAQIDELIARRAHALASAEPERLVFEVDELVARLRDDLLARREQRAMDRNFLALHPRLGGGGSLYGQADAESFATLVEALDGAAEPPGAEDDGEDAHGARGRQRMEALVGICESWLSGGAGVAGAARPRPRFLVSLDGTDELGIAAAGRVLHRLAGQPVRLSRLATETLLCDAALQIVLFKDGQPIGISDTAETVPAKVRAAVLARDGGCRFPGCDAPAGWSDAHHIIPRPQGDNSVGNLILLCRRCHWRIHHRGWRLRFLKEGTAEFRHRGRAYTSQPRARAPARE